MLHVMTRLAAAASLLMGLAACSDDGKDAEDDRPAGGSGQAELAPGITGTVEEPESLGGCKTSVQVARRAAEDAGEFDVAELVHPAAVGSKEATQLTLYASDEELDLDELPGSPRAGDGTFLVINIEAKKDEARPIAQGTRILTSKKKEPYSVSLQLASGSEEPSVAADAETELIFAEFRGEGAGVCVRLRHTDAEKSVRGTFFAPLTLTP